VTITSVLFHPAAFAGGVADAEIDGGVLAIFKVMLAALVFPAISVAVPVMT
jgi:hypothetical protein